MKAMRPFLPASYCAYRLFWLCYECNCMTVLWMQLHERWKSQICSWCWSYSVKYNKKVTTNYNLSRKWIQLKVKNVWISCQNIWISSLILIWIFWWIELAVLRSHRKVYQNCIFDFKISEKKICILPDLNCFLPHWQTCFVPSVGRDFIQWQILYVIRP